MANTRQTTYEVTSQHQGSIMLLHQYISCNSDTYFSWGHTNRYWNVILNYIVIYKVKSSVIYIMVHPAVAILGE